MNLFDSVDPPYLTADLPGVGGRLRSQPEDFEVEEIPAYEPSGEGEHLFLWIEKRGTGAEWLLKHVAQRLDMRQGDIGCGGLKDRHAVTRQYLSVPAKAAEGKLEQLDGDGIKVLHAKRHGNKLRNGHTKGNRFRIRIRDVAEPANVEPILERIRQYGLPNYYGEQRFGRGNETLEIGLKMLAGERPRVPHFLKKLALSSVQSALFNAALGARIKDNLLKTVLAGDVMMKRPSGGLFVAEEFPREQERFDAGETVHSGPMFGTKMFPCKADAAEREVKLLVASGLTPASFEGFGNLMEGTRRPNLVFFDRIGMERDADGVVLDFTLPSGGYATVLLREVMEGKRETPLEGEPPTEDAEG